MPAVPLGASGQGVAGPRLHGRARPVYHRHVTDTERPDNGSSSEPGTQKRPTRQLQPPPGPFQGLGTHDSEVCYKYMCLVSEGDRGRRGGCTQLVKAWRLNTTGTDSPPARQAGSILGPVTLGCWGAGRGPVQGNPARVGSSIWTQLTSFRALRANSGKTKAARCTSEL